MKVTCLAVALLSAAAVCGAPADSLRVAAVNCGAFHYGRDGVAESEYAAGWESLAKDSAADVFFYEDVGRKGTNAVLNGSVGFPKFDIRVFLRDGKGELAIVELPNSIDVNGVTRKTSRFRALRVVREWCGRKVALYGLHLVAESHIPAPKPPKGEMSFSQKLRRRQFEALIEDAKKFDCAVFAGDFNAQRPFEYDVFKEAGYVLGNCSERFGVNITLRKLPADNIVISRGLAFLDFDVPQNYRLNTDHFPVRAKIAIAGEKATIH